MEELKRALAELRNSSKLVNAITDRASDMVRDVETFLNKECGIGIYSWVEVTSDFEAESGVTSFTHLAYKRVNGKFRIAVEHGNDVTDDLDTKAWAECDREEKLETVKKLPELLLTISRNATGAAREAEPAITAIAESLQSSIGNGGSR